MTRRELIQIAALYAGAALVGAVGGLTAQEDGRWHESEESGDDEPPSRREQP